MGRQREEKPLPPCSSTTHTPPGDDEDPCENPICQTPGHIGQDCKRRPEAASVGERGPYQGLPAARPLPELTRVCAQLQPITTGTSPSPLSTPRTGLIIRRCPLLLLSSRANYRTRDAENSGIIIAHCRCFNLMALQLCSTSALSMSLIFVRITITDVLLQALNSAERERSSHFPVGQITNADVGG
jgi:hypothetical protein